MLAYLTSRAPRAYNVAIFTNRKDVSASQDYLALLHRHGGDADVFVATANDRNRKPMRGM